MKIETIRTDRTLLRKIDPQITEYVRTEYSDEDLILFLGLDSQEALEKEKTKWEKGMSTYKRSFLYFQIIDPPTNKMIGWCGYHTWYIDHDRAEIGYGFFAEENKKKGLMTEVMPYVLDYGFEEMNLHRIEAMVSPTNEASLRILEKFNFNKEGLLKEHYLKDGVYEDSLVFSLLNSK